MKTEFEINKRLAELLGWKISENQREDYSIVNVQGVYGIHAEVDYCNSWADMGQIIERNQISIYSFITYWRCSSLLVKDLGFYVDSENPLKAAALVAIKILESRL